jgi:hypothetical protein
VVIVKTDPGGLFANGRVTGTSFWQVRRVTGWEALDGPGEKRHTAILRSHFLSRFEPLEEQ